MMKRYNTSTALTNPFEALFNDPFFGLAASRVPSVKLTRQPSHLRLATDLYEDAENYYARVELPGAKRDEVQIALDKGLLTITYEKRTEGADGPETVNFRRALQTPEGIQADAVSAKLEDGVLTLTLPKEEEVKPRQIEIG